MCGLNCIVPSLLVLAAMSIIGGAQQDLEDTPPSMKGLYVDDLPLGIDNVFQLIVDWALSGYPYGDHHSYT